MERIDRWLSILMCMCMLCTSMLGDLAPAFAEGAETEAVIAAVSEELPSGDEESELTLGEETSAEPEPEVEAGEEPAEFTFGYARLAEDAGLFAELDSIDALATLSAGGVVLVTEVESDRMKVAFAYEGAAEEGWVNAAALEPLTEDEVAAFQSEITEAICYQDDVNYPLPEPALVLPEATAEPETTAEPESEEASELSAPSEPEVEAEDDSDSEVMMQTALYSTDDEETSEVVDETESETAVVMTLAQSDAELTVGETVEIQPAFSDGVNRSVSYTLSASGVVSIDAASGVATAVAPGSVTVQVKCAEIDASASLNITVLENIEIPSENEPSGAVTAENIEISISPASLELMVGESQTISCTLPEGTEGVVEYALSAEEILSLDETGAVTALQPGECTITASLMVDGAAVATAQCTATVYAPVTEFELTVENAVLNAGETTQMIVSLPEYTRGEATFASKNPLVVGVDASGMIMAIGPGAAEVTATIGDVTRTATVEVYGKPSSLPLVVEETTLAPGYHTQATVELSEYVVAEITYRSSDSEIASVDVNGVVTAVSEGYCEIIAEADNGVEARVLVQVVDSVVSLSTKYHEMAVGQTLSLNYTISDEEYVFEQVVFSSSDTSVATVDAATGLVKAVSDGEATITLALGETGMTAKCYVTVSKAPTRVSITSATKTIGVKQITDAIGYTLYADDEPTIGTVTFKSSNTKVVMLNSIGQMLGVKAGTATVTVTSYNGYSASFKVTVKKAPSKLTISPTAASLAVGQTGKIGYTLTSGTAAGMTFVSSDENVATVDGSGNVTAVGVGVAKIKVSTHNGLVKYSTITVNKAPENVTLSLSATKLGVGMTATAKGAVDTTSHVGFTYEYWTDAPDILSVDVSTGAIKALQVGEANVFVRTYNGVTDQAVDGGRVETSVKVNVVPEPDYVTIEGTDFNIIAGRIITLPISMTMDDGSTDCMTTYTLTTSNSKVAIVNNLGQVKGVKAGTATITVTAGNGDVVSCKVVVMSKPTKVVLNRSSLTIGEGMTSSLAAKVYYSSSKYYIHGSEDALGMGKFYSSDESVVKIDSSTGEIYAVAKGNATLTYKTHNNISASCKVTVLGKPTAIGLNADSLKLGVNMTSTLTAVYQENEMGPVTFSSSNPAVAEVDATTGKVTALSMGDATITIDAGEDVTNTCEVKVVPEPDHVTIDGTDFNIIAGRIITLPISMTMEDGSTDCMTTYKLSTSNSKVAIVNNLGQVKGVKAGTATITVTAGNGDVVSCKVVVMSKPTKVVLNRSSLTIGEGMTSSLAAKVYYSSSKYYIHGSEDALGMGKFYSSDESVVKIDAATGEIYAVAKGNATLTYKTLNNISASCKVTVLGKPTAIDLNADSLKLGVNMTSTLTAVYQENEMGPVTFSSSNPAVAEVDATTGKVTAISMGDATITIDAGEGVTNTCEVKVVPEPDHVTIEGTDFNIIAGRIITLPISMTMEDGSTDCMTTYTLKTSNSKVAIVNNLGQVKGVKAGTATITVTAGNGDVVSCKVVVMSKPTKVVLNRSSLTIGEGMTSGLAAKVYYSSSKYYIHGSEDALGMGKFYSSDESVVKIDSATGEIYAVAKGNVTLTYKTHNNISASCKVTVLGKPTAIGLNVDSLKLGVNMTSTLTAVYQANEMGPVTFSSSNPAVAEVDATTGKVTAISMGDATITIDAGEGVTNTCEVNVVPEPDHVTIDGTDFNIIAGRIITLPISMTMEDGSTDCMTTYKLSTSNSKVAIVNNLGQVKGVKAGTATITVTAGNGDVVSCKVVVMSKPTKVVLNRSSLTIGEGMTSGLAAKVYYSSSKYYIHGSEDALGMGKFYSSDEGVVKIDAATGEIDALAKGNATLTYKTYNGKSASCKVTVLAEPTSLNLSATSLTLGEKMTSTLGVTFNAYEYGSLTFVSDNEDVVTVSASGKITAVGAGDATVTVTAHNGVSAVCAVHVAHGPDEISLNMTSSNLAIKGTVTLKPTGTYLGSADDCMTTYTYLSSNSKIATVTSTGVVKGVKAGTAIIRVFAQNGTYADCTVVVRKAPTKAIFAATQTTIGVGQTIVMPAKVYYSGGSCIVSANDTSYVRLSIDDPTIAKLDTATGEVTGVEVGYTYLRLTTYNGKTAKCKILVSPGAEWIALSDNILCLSRGDTHTLTCSQSAGSLTTITYESSNPAVVSVSDDGELTAIAQGSATITASSSNGKTSTCEVTVMAKPESITFESDSVTIGLNETAALPEISVTSSEGECSQAVAYSVSGSAVTMAAPGYVTGAKAGTAVVTATTSNGLTATCTVTVQPEPTEMSLTASASAIAVGDTANLSVTMDAAGSYTFTVDNSDVLKVTAAGKVTALNPGTATITATAYNGCSASCTIDVLAVPQWVRLSEDEAVLGVDSRLQLTATLQQNTLGTVAYASSNENVATVDEDGNVTAVAPGAAEIRAYVVGHEDVFDTCNLTVLAKPTAVTLSETELTLRKGATVQLEATFSGDDGADCYGSAKFESSDSGVADVDENGSVTAVGAGEATITVSLDSDAGVTASCKVVVVETSVGFDVSALTLSVGETYVLRVDLPDGENGFSIESSSETVVAVDASTFVLTAEGEGTATITAVNGDDTAVCTVKVTQKPEAISIPAEKRLVIGKTFALNAELLPAGTVAQLTYASSDEEVATVDADGMVKAVGYGSAVIRVTNQDGSLSAECAVTAVYEPEMIRFGELEDIVIAAGDSYALQAPVMYNAAGDCDSTYTLAISNATCASLSVENGSYFINALTEGTATLRLKTANGKTATHTVTVVDAPTSIAFESAAFSMAVGESFAPAVVGSNGAAVSVNLTSDDSCVSITEDGQLKAESEGTATITATSVNFPGLTATATVQVVKVPASVSLSPASVTLAVGEDSLLVPQFDSGAASANVKFASSDETVVRAGSNGAIIAMGVGTATVTAMAFGGASATCKVTVKAAPTALSVQPGSISACIQDAIQLNVSFGSTAEYANLSYESDDTSVASVSESGLVTFSKVGETVIYVSAFNGLSVEVPVTVSETPSSVRFGSESAVLLVGDAATLDVVFDKGAGYCTLTSSDPATASVSEDGTVRGLKAGATTITLEMPGLGLSAKCELTVVDALDGIELIAEKTTLELHETTQLSYALAPSNAIGTGLVTFESSDPDVAEVDRRTGLVTGVAYGTAVITATTADGKTAQCEINVLGGKRRMLVAYYFGEAGDTGYLPFAYNNGYSMTQAFSASTVEGQQYDIAGPYSNASKSALFGNIASHFADATDDDVSVIYICAHGTAAGPTGEYAFALDGTHYVMASELMSALEKIKGRVVLIMDSCHSGGMIDCNQSRLDAQGGRISIIASSHRETSSSYWNVSQKLTSIDFYTHAVLQGIGFNEADGIGGARGWSIGYEPADYAGDNNGQVTLGELFSYAKAVTVSNVKKFQGYSQFIGNAEQTPQSYIGSMNEDLVIFAR